MANQVVMPPELDPGKSSAAQGQDNGPRLGVETDQSIWLSLIATVRDAFRKDKQPPLQLTSQAVESDLILQEESVFQSLYENIRDVFFPRKLPPLVLTSQPVAVVDRMAFKRSPRSTAFAVLLHVIVIALILFFIYRVRKVIVSEPKTVAQNIDVSLPIAPVKMTVMGGGGGGGDRDVLQAARGKLPEFKKEPITPPVQVIRNDNPKLPVTPALNIQPDVKLPNNNLPLFGDPKSQVVGPASNGTGSGGGIGSGSNGGIGSGRGNGYGPGEGGNTGGGIYHVGGGVMAPQLIYGPDPEFSDEARKAKYQGVVVVNLVVDAGGNPQRIRVIRPLGMGLDEKAVEAVRQYKFRPAMLNGKAVPVEINIEVNFHIY
jgi:TonB family protein